MDPHTILGRVHEDLTSNEVIVAQSQGRNSEKPEQ